VIQEIEELGACRQRVMFNDPEGAAQRCIHAEQARTVNGKSPDVAERARWIGNERRAIQPVAAVKIARIRIAVDVGAVEIQSGKRVVGASDGRERRNTVDDEQRRKLPSASRRFSHFSENDGLWTRNEPLRLCRRSKLQFP
jgi:hypothetical protein